MKVEGRNNDRAEMNEAESKAQTEHPATKSQPFKLHKGKFSVPIGPHLHPCLKSCPSHSF